MYEHPKSYYEAWHMFLCAGLLNDHFKGMMQRYHHSLVAIMFLAREEIALSKHKVYY